MEIFEPGCGTGVMLFHFKDRFKGNITGIDIDPIAISNAKIIGDTSDKFYHVDAVKDSFLEKIENNTFDICIFSSHLKYTIHLKNYKQYFSQLLRISKRIVLHEKYKEEIIDLFDEYKIINYTIINNEILAYIECE